MIKKTGRKKKLIVFTDGSCLRNGKGKAVGGIGIHFPNKELRDVGKVYRLGPCTNQKAELYAILTALRYINKMLGLKNYQIHIKTDSQYSIDSVTKWIYMWIKNGWKTISGKPVANREFIELIHKYYKRYDISFEHVESHTNKNDPNSIGNRNADKLATRSAKRGILEKVETKEKSEKWNKASFPIDTNFVVELVKTSK
ncbi:MAG: ribonuclease H family protein [Thermoplasmata archaeon]